jgi:membrane fusion protein, multidrug efflux system
MPKPRLALRSSIAAIVAIAVLGGASLWLIDRSSAVYTSDARVRASMVTLSSDVAGRIIDLPIKPGDHVKAGDLLARLDDRQASLAVTALSLELKAVEAEVARENLRVDLSRTAGDNRIGARRAALAAARADLTAAQSQLEIVGADFNRTSTLKASGLVTQTLMDRASTQLEAARQAEARARAALTQAEAGIGEAEAEAGEAGIFMRNVEVLSLRAHALRQQIVLRKVELARHAIASPINGVVDEVFADNGEYVAPGARIALLHNATDLWIEANVKEAEIARVSAGARVEVRLDAAPDRACTGRVDRVRSATAAEFALIPNANPTGVFTKIAQRVPVRIVIDGSCEQLRPGAMASLRIVAHDRAR